MLMRRVGNPVNQSVTTAATDTISKAMGFSLARKAQTVLCHVAITGGKGGLLKKGRITSQITVKIRERLQPAALKFLVTLIARSQQLNATQLVLVMLPTHLLARLLLQPALDNT